MNRVKGNYLCKDTRNVQNLQLFAPNLVLFLRYRVCNHNLVDGRRIDAVNGISAENAVGNQSVNLGCLAPLLEQLRSAGEGIGGIGHIVNKDSDLVGKVSDEHHCRGVAVSDAGRAALLLQY